MTTDLVTRKNAEMLAGQQGGIFGGLFQKTKSSGFSGGSPSQGATYIDENLIRQKVIGSALAGDETQERIMNATFALLKQARLMLDEAEAKIQAQDERISYLEDLATSDELTGLKNRRGFLEVFMQELDRCKRGLSCGGLLVLIDLDNFKSVNDTFGHLAGDACLRLVGRTLDNEIRQMDIAARLGGDEFVLLLSNTTKAQAARRAQELAWRLNNLSVAWYGEEIPVQASLGLRDYGAKDTISKIFNDADMRLYANKQRKNRKSRSSGKARMTHD